MTANVCVSSVVRFRSRVLSPTQNVERRYKFWATPHRTIEETFCWVLGVSVDRLFEKVLIGQSQNCPKGQSPLMSQGQMEMSAHQGFLRFFSSLRKYRYKETPISPVGIINCLKSNSVSNVLLYSSIMVLSSRNLSNRTIRKVVSNIVSVLIVKAT